MRRFSVQFERLVTPRPPVGVIGASDIATNREFVIGTLAFASPHLDRGIKTPSDSWISVMIAIDRG